MGQVLFTESIEELVLASTTTVTLAPSIINIGGQQYQNSTTMTLDFSTTGLNGLDTGAIAASSGYNIFAVYTGSEFGLAASLASTPSGYTQYELIGTAVTDADLATLHEVSNSTTPLADQTENLGNKTSSQDQADVGLISVPNTQIVGRALIRDLSKIPSPKMGVERMLFRELKKIQNEVGPDGQQVQVDLDPLSRIRYVGGWEAKDNTDNTYGNYITSSDDTDFIEITFYGTGLNYLQISHSTNYDFYYKIDGGGEVLSEGIAGSDILGTRNTSPNIVMPLVSGLSLGQHTISVRNGRASGGNFISGFEILNESTTIDIPANSAILAGEDRHLIPAGQNLGYATQGDFDSDSDDPMTDGKGGAVVVYSERQTDGSIQVKQRLNATDGVQKNLASADHSNEEVVQKFNFRQFGVGGADDFSTLSTVSDDRAFTLDDGTTTLVADDVVAITYGNVDGIAFVADGDYLALTFVGTGLDVMSDSDGTVSNNHEVFIDGSSIGTLVSPASTTGIRKIVSGLPYGTHTAKIRSLTNSGNHTAYSDFIIYAPKKPSIPEGAGKLGSYYLMADFSAPAIDDENVANGVIRKQNIRECVYAGGSWSINGSLFPTRPSGFLLSTTANTDTVEYTFFGTGFDLRFDTNTAGSETTLEIDGSTDFSSLTTALRDSSGATWTPADGTIDDATAAGAGISVEGLPLGLHTFKATKSNGTGTLEFKAFDVITPVHSYEASAELLHDRLIGSNSIKAEMGLPNFHKEKQHFPQGVDLGASKTKWQKKVMATQLTDADTGSAATELSFSGLTIGKVYRISIVGDFERQGDGDNVYFYANQNSVEMYVGLSKGLGSETYERAAIGGSTVFTCTDTTMNIVGIIDAGCLIYASSTFSLLEELPNHIETDEW